MAHMAELKDSRATGNSLEQGICHLMTAVWRGCFPTQKQAEKPEADMRQPPLGASTALS